MSASIAKLIEAELGTSTTVSGTISSTWSKQITHVESNIQKTITTSGITAVVPGNYWFLPTLKIITHPVTINQPDADGKLIGSKTIYIHTLKYGAFLSIFYEHKGNICLLDKSGKIVKNYGPLK